jgi:Glycosyltransferase Family 4
MRHGVGQGVVDAGNGKRILQTIATMEGGGAERQLNYLCDGLVRRGWEVHVVCLRGKGLLAPQPAGTEFRIMSCGWVRHFPMIVSWLWLPPIYCYRRRSTKPIR